MSPKPAQDPSDRIFQNSFVIIVSRTMILIITSNPFVNINAEFSIAMNFLVIETCLKCACTLSLSVFDKLII